MEGILVLVYCIAGYWACGVTIYANKIRFGKWNDLFLNRLIAGILLGWILIPVALIKTLLGSR